MLRQPPLPPDTTARLLVEGGDGRITLDPLTGVNRYGCRATPYPELLSFSSATASVISSEAYAAADCLRDELQQELQHDNEETVYSRQLQALRTALLDLCELQDQAQTEVIFAASGTDLHHIATQISLAADKSGLTVLMVDEEETGSGVHASISYAAPDIEIITIALRENDGSTRPSSLIDAEFSSRALQAQALGRQVLLIQTDVSKTGIIAPSYDCTATLSLTLGDGLDVLIDACQFRISTATLHACLQRGYNVAVTGSKFVGGPSFSGALIIPAQSAKRIRERYLNATPPMPASSAGDIWQARYIDPGSWGVLLRWEAALCELRAFRQLPATAVSEFLRRFSDAISHRLTSDNSFSPVAVPVLQRTGLHQEQSWDEIASIYTFRVRGADLRILDAKRLATLYRLLPSSAIPCQLAQPVACVSGKDALRLCLSAHQIVAACRSDADGARIIAEAQQVLDQVVLMTKRQTARVITHNPAHKESHLALLKRVSLG